MVSSSLEQDCGPLQIEFFNAEDRSPLDTELFFDDRSQEPGNAFKVTRAEDGNFRFGDYQILYRIFYEQYPEVEVEQTNPFTISVVDPCDDANHNSLTGPTL